MSLVPVATLSTLSRKHPGFPFGSLMPFALDSAGRPIFLISNMAMHTQNLKADPRCSLFVTQASADGDPLGAARATLVGNAVPVPDGEIASARETYLARHENSRYWVDFADFSFLRLEPIDLYYVGGFGVMGWVEAGDYEQAAPDPLAEAARRHLSEDATKTAVAQADAIAQAAGMKVVSIRNISVDSDNIFQQQETLATLQVNEFARDKNAPEPVNTASGEDQLSIRVNITAAATR
jgi:putative heme iron utilization protein